LSSVKGKNGIECKLTHHKIILKNLPPEIQRFSITDGFNLLTLNHLWIKSGFALSVGGGIVITHPESTVRNEVFPENNGIFNEGYYVSGPTIEAALQKHIFFTPNWFVSGEGRTTAAYVKVPVAQGHARLGNIALHVLVGVGYRFKS
jgi:hypothetical protein